MAEIPTTQRAYTLRLRGANKEDQSWRDALWATHESVNKGAMAFGDWLLTLRGGLDHRLVNELVPQAKKGGKEQPPRPPSDEEKRDRRIILALSWMSVESQNGAPQDNRVERDGTLKALRDILNARGASNNEIRAWVQDCTRCLSARIREDACWVNRSQVFDNLCARCDVGKAREDARKVLWHLFGKDYLTLPRKQEKKAAKTKTEPSDSEPASEEELAEEQRSVAIQSGKGAGQRTRHLFSHIFGTKADSKGFGKQSAMELRDWWKEQLKPWIAECGIVLSEGTKQKERKDSRSPTELHREMLSKAAARLAQIHTKQKQQEVDRQNREAADAELRQLELDGKYQEALRKLEQYFENRTPRLRQVNQWHRIVRAWASISEDDPARASELREEAAKKLQDELRDEKFGDINLFTAFADEEFCPIWQHNGKVDASILETYVKGRKARDDAERLKVASYRHPDPYYNPVYCQFGVSRPHIDFARLSRIKSKDKAAEDVRAVELLLWDGKQSKRRILFGASKRLDREIGSACDSASKNPGSLPIVSRRSRLGLFELGKLKEQKPRVAAVFDRKEKKPRKPTESDKDGEPSVKEASWNGTLFADRRALKRLGDKSNSNGNARHDALHWWLIVSLELQPQGPWFDLVRESPDKTPFQRTVRKDETGGRKRKKGTKFIASNGWPHEEINKPLKGGKNGLVVDSAKERKGHAQLILCRLPGLRVLSVDLGHRFAAACAVWETLTRAQMVEACKAANQDEPKQDDLFIHLTRETEKLQKSGKKKGKPVVETTVYRRIGDDKLPDGTDHPAPWARLDRQCVVKLQGEEKPARWASDDERDQVNRLGEECCYQRPKPARARDRRVDELMSEAVRIVRLALRRHGDSARISFRLTATHKQLPGGRVADQQMTETELVDHLQDVLMLWYDLAHSKDWKDEWAAQQWEALIVRVANYQQPSIPDEDATGPQRRKHRELLRQSLKPIAELLAAEDRSRLAIAWNAQWERNDAAWKSRLKWLRRWLLPRNIGRPRDIKGNRIVETDEQYRARKSRRGSARNVGGLSLTRVATIRSLYQVLKAYKMRPEPDNPRKNIPDKDDDSLRNFGRRVLDAMDRMREQRVKQLASRIVEAALGIGSENKWKHWNKGKRPRTRIDEDRFKPCHAVVIENLTIYRPEETRTRRENRQLMNWCSSKVKKYLSEGCQLHGLHLREVPAAYTSRQDSRTGLPGIRCVDVTSQTFRSARHWRTRVRQAAEKNDEESRFLVYVDMHSNASKLLRLPLRSGDLFVSVEGRALQADLNAAANIGLRALLDPDWPGKWWYVPCKTDTGRPVADKVKGSAAVDSNLPLAAKATGDRKKEKDIVNQWRDCSSEPLRPEQFKVYDAYWNGVRSRVVSKLRKFLGTVEKPIKV